MIRYLDSIAWLVIAGFFAIIYFSMFKYDRNKFALRRFHNAIKLAHKEHNPSISYDEVLDKLLLDYNAMIRHIGQVEYSSCSEMLEQIFYRYDTYSDRDFQEFFKEKREIEVRDFTYTLYKQMKGKGPFIDLSEHEVKIVNTIKQTMEEQTIGKNEVLLEQLIYNLKSRTRNVSAPVKKNKVVEWITLIGAVITAVQGITGIIDNLISIIS